MNAQEGNEHLPIQWYRVPLDKRTLQELNHRSDWKAALQTVGYLGLLALTGGTAIYAAGRWSWWWVVILLYLHGSFFHFLINGVHELSHGTVFRTQWAGELALQVLSLLGQYHYQVFQESHRRHHRYTLHAPYDSEVVLPIQLDLKSMLKTHFINLRAYWIYKEHWRIATGHLDAPWHQILFPASKPMLRKRLVNWSRLTLVFHALLSVTGIILAVTVHPRWLLLPVVTTFGRFYGQWLQFLINSTQHVGLSDNVPDFRLCARSIRINPFFAFLYWQMQYHIEHHMYAGVPFYNLPALNRLIRDQLPPPPNGLIATWRHIVSILRAQKEDPSYCFVPTLPPASA